MLGPAQVLPLCKKDLPDFFPNLDVGEEKAKRNAVGRGYSPAELKTAGFAVPDDLVGEPILWATRTPLLMPPQGTST